MAEIADEIKRLAAYVGIAVAAGIVAGLLLSVGLPLFLGDWIFGSIGWGLLHGLLLLTAIIVSMVLLVVDIPASRIAAAYFAGVVIAIVVGIVLGLDLTNRLWQLAGDALLPLAAPDARALAAALVVLPVALGLLFGLAGLVRAAGSRDGRSSSLPVGAAVAAAAPAAIYVGWLAAFIYAYSARVAWFDWALLVAGLLAFVATILTVIVVTRTGPGVALTAGLSSGAGLGVALGALTAIALGPRVGLAVGVTVGLLSWIGAMGFAVARRTEFDMERYFEKFIPQKTIDMTKETIEWARARMPLSRGS